MPRRAVLALLGAGAGIALLAATWLAAFHVGVVERADQSIFRGFSDLSRHPHVDSVANWIASLCNPQPYVYLAAVPVLVALARRRGRLAVAICAILLGANVTAQLLKPLLAHPRAAALLGGASPIGAASWPSGHATAAMSLALCCVLAAPARLRPFAAALGAAFAVAVSYSFLALAWHYPSDVFGGFLVAGTWTLLGVAAWYIAATRPSSSAEPRAALSVRAVLTPPALVLIGSLVLVALVVLDRPHQVVDYARLHRTFVIGAAAIAGSALALATGLTLALRRSERPPA
jgi:membrane-associated phospholipid phosphatase